MSRTRRLLSSLLFSLLVGTAVFGFLLTLFIALTGPHTPLNPFVGVLAVVSVIACNVLWQHKFGKKSK